MANNRHKISDLTRSNYGVTICVVVLSSFVMSIACKPRVKSKLDDTGQRNAYSFGGACGSRGYWTQTAISRADEISSVLTKLKDNPKCKKVYDSLKDMSEIKSTYTPPAQSGYRFSRSMALSREITTLNSYIKMTDFKRGDALALLLDRTLEQKTLQTENLSESQRTSDIVEKDNGQLQIARNAADSVQNRMDIAAQVGMDRLQKYYQALSESAECVNDNPALSGSALITQGAQILGAFASGDPVTASNVGNVMNSFSKMLRDSKYNNSMLREKEAVFAESIGCMLESVQYSYCAARDAQSILSSGGDRLQKKANAGGLDRNSAFYGYYMMSFHLPIITRWLNDVIAGYIPRKWSDAKRINGIFQIPVAVEAYNVQFNAVYAERMRDFLMQSDETGRASSLLQLVKALEEEVNYVVFPKRPLNRNNPPPKRSVARGDIPNFFGQSTPGIALPFRLIGITPDNIPKACIKGTKEAAGNPLNFTSWASATSQGFQPIFFRTERKNDAAQSSELSLPEIIRIQLDGVIEEGRAAASEYFWKNVPMDFEAIANDAGSGQIGSAIKSLAAVQAFLLDQMIAARNENTREAKMNIISMKDTYERIDAVQIAYKKFISDTASDTAAKEFIRTVYEKLNLVFQGSSFLPQRLVGLVKRDLVKKVTQQKLGANSLQSEILIAASDLAFEQIVNSLGTNPGDPQSGKNQLATAQAMNMTSLQAIDTVFHDKLIAVISFYRNIAKGAGDTSNESVFNDSYLRSRMDSRILPRLSSDTFLDRVVNFSLDQAELVGVSGFIRRSLNPDLYPMPSPWQGPGYGEDEFGSNATVWAMLCTLTLALPDPDKYASVCDGAVLYSPYESSNKSGMRRVGPLSLPYTNWRRSFYAVDGDPDYSPSPQCAYYDVSRRNQIYAMTLDHVIVGDSGVLIPLPSTSGHGEREFVLNELIANPAGNLKSVHDFVSKKIGKVPANTTYCASNGYVAPQVCSEYDQSIASRGAANHGTVAVPCYDLKGQVFYCCNGSFASGLIPTSGTSPCFKSMTDISSSVLTLTDKDL